MKGQWKLGLTSGKGTDSSIATSGLIFSKSFNDFGTRSRWVWMKCIST